MQKQNLRNVGKDMEDRNMDTCWENDGGINWFRHFRELKNI